MRTIQLPQPPGIHKFRSQEPSRWKKAPDSENTISKAVSVQNTATAQSSAVIPYRVQNKEYVEESQARVKNINAYVHKHISVMKI